MKEKAQLEKTIETLRENSERQVGASHLSSCSKVNVYMPLQLCRLQTNYHSSPSCIGLLHCYLQSITVQKW